ncbi:MAG: hypothetical protein HZB16_19565 [Armatimonadetes bacterium]|nr:hypothetical protein [Armatimonadota bacterium]
MLDPLVLWLFAWCALAVQPRLVYLANGPIFQVGAAFAQRQLAWCGGPAQYAGAFLAQLDHWDLAGALIRCLQALLIGWLAQRAVAAVTGRETRVVRWLAMLPYLLLSGRFDANPAIGLMAVGLLAAAWLRAALPRSRPLVHAALCLALAYTVGGADGRAGLWVTLASFGLLAAVAERRWAALAQVLTALATAGVAGLFLAPAGVDAPRQPALITQLLTYALLLAAPACAAAIRLWPERAATGQPAPSRGQRLVLIVGAVAVVHLLAGLVAARQPARLQAERDELVLAEQWDQVLTRLGRQPGLDALAIHDIDTALAHRGRLAEDLFRYPQLPEALVLPMSVPNTFSARLRLADQYLLLGRPNQAEYALQNALAHTGDNPYLLRRLVLTYLVKGDTDAARLYLRVLRRDIVHGGWAREQLRRLARDPSASFDPRVAELRAGMVERDDLLEITDTAKGEETVAYFQNVSLSNLLDARPGRRLALDYLMSLYLVNGRPDGVVQEMHRLRGCGMTRIPAPWEDALLIQMSVPGAKIDLHGLAISDEGYERMRRFGRLLASEGGNLRTVWPRVASALPGTFLAYMTRLKVGG